MIYQVFSFKKVHKQILFFHPPAGAPAFFHVKKFICNIHEGFQSSRRNFCSHFISAGIDKSWTRGYYMDEWLACANYLFSARVSVI